MDKGDIRIDLYRSKGMHAFLEAFLAFNQDEEHVQLARTIMENMTNTGDTKIQNCKIKFSSARDL